MGTGLFKSIDAQAIAQINWIIISTGWDSGISFHVFVLLQLLSDSTVWQMDSDIKLQAKTNTSWKMIRPEFSFDPHLRTLQTVNISKLREFTYLRAHLTQSSLLKYSPGFCRQIWVWDSWTTVIKLFLALLELIHINVIDLYANWLPLWTRLSMVHSLKTAFQKNLLFFPTATDWRKINSCLENWI